ncbi:MAG TPA: hypothetical protein VIK91_10525 [Nannocystis sp.]
MEVELVDRHETFRARGRLRAVVRVEEGCAPGDVRDHADKGVITVGQAFPRLGASIGADEARFGEASVIDEVDEFVAESAEDGAAHGVVLRQSLALLELRHRGLVQPFEQLLFVAGGVEAVEVAVEADGVADASERGLPYLSEQPLGAV